MGRQICHYTRVWKQNPLPRQAERLPPVMTFLYCVLSGVESVIKRLDLDALLEPVDEVGTLSCLSR